MELAFRIVNPGYGDNKLHILWVLKLAYTLIYFYKYLLVIETYKNISVSLGIESDRKVPMYIKDNSDNGLLYECYNLKLHEIYGDFRMIDTHILV